MTKVFCKQIFNNFGKSQQNMGYDKIVQGLREGMKKIDHNSNFPNLTKNIKTLGIVESK